MEGVSAISREITKDNLPEGIMRERDGACWTAVFYPKNPNGWRWRPENLKALHKGEPEGEMLNFILPVA